MQGKQYRKPKARQNTKQGKAGQDKESKPREGKAKGMAKQKARQGNMQGKAAGKTKQGKRKNEAGHGKAKAKAGQGKTRQKKTKQCNTERTARLAAFVLRVHAVGAVCHLFFGVHY